MAVPESAAWFSAVPLFDVIATVSYELSAARRTVMARPVSPSPVVLNDAALHVVDVLAET